jgi:hypothetical protein
MPRRPANVTKADIARALRAAEQVAPGRHLVEVTADGVIRIVPIDAAARPGAVAVAEVDPADPFARGLGVVP